MGKYAEDARQLLLLVGGKENIAAVSHCMTRMRFALADPEKADVKAIEALKSVKGSFTQSGQFQVISGNTVADLYNEFVQTAGSVGGGKAHRQAEGLHRQGEGVLRWADHQHQGGGGALEGDAGRRPALSGAHCGSL